MVLWGLLLAVAPCATAVIVWQRIEQDVWATATSAGLAAAAVVGLFFLSVGRTAFRGP